MEVQEFIAESLKQIAEGVTKAQAEVTGALVNPGRLDAVDEMAPELDGKFLVANKMMGRLAQIVEFDLAVTVSKEFSGEGNAGLTVVGIGGTLKGKREILTSEVSRLRFAIPIVLPLDER